MARITPDLKYRGKKAVRSLITFIAVATLCLGGNALAWLSQSQIPVVEQAGASFDAEASSLTIKGNNFLSGAVVILKNAQGAIGYTDVKVKSSGKIVITGVRESDILDGVEVTVVNPDGLASLPVRLAIVPTVDNSKLTKSDVTKIIQQAVAQAEASNLKVTVAVTDKEGNVLGVFKMTGATDRITIGIGTRCARTGNCITRIKKPTKLIAPKLTCGLEGLCIGRIPAADITSVFPTIVGKDFPGLAVSAAISKAGTAGVLSTAGGAFSTRSASFLLQEHLPPGIAGAPAGPLFGVQFSQLACSDINPSLPLGLAADPGGVALYKNGQPVGGVGVEGDGIYALANRREERTDKPVEELIALAGTRGFEPPTAIADTLFPDALRLPYINQQVPPALALRPLNATGTVLPEFPIIDTPASKFTIINLNGIPVRAKIDRPIIGSSLPGGLTKAEVERILFQGVQRALQTRAIIHQPVGSHIEVSVGVVDQQGNYLGAVSTTDAPISSYDIAVQKARSAAFVSNPVAGNQLRQASGGGFLPPKPFAKYAEAARRDGLNLDGSFAISGRGLIFLSRPFLPDGIDDTENGPFSNPIEDNSAFNTGLQLDLVLSQLLASALVVTTINDTPGIPKIPATTPAFVCSPDTAVFKAFINNGLQVRQASVPLYKNGRLVGGVGCSGDGGEQEDIVVGFGSAGFEADPNIRSDRLIIRGVRIPWLKFPRHPEIDN